MNRRKFVPFVLVLGFAATATSGCALPDEAPVNPAPQWAEDAPPLRGELVTNANAAALADVLVTKLPLLIGGAEDASMSDFDTLLAPIAMLEATSADVPEELRDLAAWVTTNQDDTALKSLFTCVSFQGSAIVYDCNFYGLRLEGTINTHATFRDIDLTYWMDNSIGGFSFTISGSINVNFLTWEADSKIDGRIAYSYVGKKSGRTYSFALDYNGVHVDNTSCRSYGTVTGWTGSSSGAPHSFGIQLGPYCKQAKVYR